jgi:type I restriction enzyme, R subunit
MTTNIEALHAIHDKVKELNRQNNLLRTKYRGDAKYTRIHKRLQEDGSLSTLGMPSERKLFEALNGIKTQADEQVLQNTQRLHNESYFARMMQPIVISEFATRQQIKLTPDVTRSINQLLVAEYMHEFSAGARPW